LIIITNPNKNNLQSANSENPVKVKYPLPLREGIKERRRQPIEILPYSPPPQPSPIQGEEVFRLSTGLLIFKDYKLTERR
jgi:hypothetical protein